MTVRLQNHTARFDRGHLLGSEETEQDKLVGLTRAWVFHDGTYALDATVKAAVEQAASAYWTKVPLPQHIVRYEDLKDATFSNLLSMLTFFLPEEGMYM